jgi:glycosyltransferase involved in cell wall biosynthesis
LEAKLGKFKKLLMKLEYKLDIFTINNADRIIVDSPAIQEYYQRITSKQIEYIPLPIKSKKFQFSELNRKSIQRELGVDKDTKLIGFVGRFEKVKNLDTLLISFAELIQDEPSVKLVLVGTGSLEPELKEYVRRKDLIDKVIFCGIRYDIDTILSSFDIFVLPSYIEGLSTSLLEAMTCGRAIVCSDIPANQQVVTHNREALLFDPHSSQELKTAIVRLIKDEPLRLKLGQSAKIRASGYDEDFVFPKILECYKMLRE